MSFKRRKEKKRESVNMSGGSDKVVEGTPLKVVGGVIRVKDNNNFKITLKKKSNKESNKKCDDNNNVNKNVNKRNLSYRVLNLFVIFLIFPSVLGLGVLSGLLVFGEIEGAFINKAILSSFDYRDDSELGSVAEKGAFLEHVEKYKNVKALAGVENLSVLLKNSALRGSTNNRFILYSGTDACIWCRFTHNVDDKYLYNNVSDFVTGDSNGIIQSMNNYFIGNERVNGPLNNVDVNKAGVIYELHDLKAKTVAEYHQGTSKSVSDVLLGQLSNPDSIKMIREVSYKDGAEVNLSSTEVDAAFTTAAAYRRYHQFYTELDSIKMKENLSTTGVSLKKALLETGVYGTPAWWFIEKGKPLYLTSTYFTIDALKKVVDWFFNDGVLV